MNPTDNSSPNPLRIDNNLLVELGLNGLPTHEKTGFLNHIYETLEMRVGIRLADQMTNEQLDEFETFYNAKDDAGAFRWLETNFPNYKDIVADEFSKLKAEIAQQAPQILAASQQQAAAAAQPQAVPATEPPMAQQTPQQPVYQQPAPMQQPPADDGTMYVSQEPTQQPMQPAEQQQAAQQSFAPSQQPVYPQSQPFDPSGQGQQQPAPPQQYPPTYPPQQPPTQPPQQW
jgi:hypothetical protein